MRSKSSRRADRVTSVERWRYTGDMTSGGVFERGPVVVDQGLTPEASAHDEEAAAAPTSGQGGNVSKRKTWAALFVAFGMMCFAIGTLSSNKEESTAASAARGSGLGTLAPPQASDGHNKDVVEKLLLKLLKNELDNGGGGDGASKADIRDRLEKLLGKMQKPSVAAARPKATKPCPAGTVAVPSHGQRRLAKSLPRRRLKNKARKGAGAGASSFGVKYDDDLAEDIGFFTRTLQGGSLPVPMPTVLVSQVDGIECVVESAIVDAGESKALPTSPCISSKSGKTSGASRDCGGGGYGGGYNGGHGSGGYGSQSSKSGKSKGAGGTKASKASERMPTPRPTSRPTPRPTRRGFEPTPEPTTPAPSVVESTPAPTTPAPSDVKPTPAPTTLTPSVEPTPAPTTLEPTPSPIAGPAPTPIPTPQNPSQCSCSPRAFTFQLNLSASCPPLPPPFPPNAVFGAGVKDYTCSIGPEPLPSNPQQIAGEDAPMTLHQHSVEALDNEAEHDERADGRRRKTGQKRRLQATRPPLATRPPIPNPGVTRPPVDPPTGTLSPTTEIPTFSPTISPTRPAVVTRPPSDSDVVPMRIYSIQFLEVDSVFNVINQDLTYVRDIDFASGDTFSYTSIAGTDEAVPGGMNMVLRGVNAAGEPIRNVFTITYTNDCGVLTFSEGESIGWVIFESFEPATEETCGKVIPSPAPTMPAPSVVEPTPAPMTPAPSVEPTPAPTTLEPTGGAPTASPTEDTLTSTTTATSTTPGTTVPADTTTAATTPGTTVPADTTTVPADTTTTPGTEVPPTTIPPADTSTAGTEVPPDSSVAPTSVPLGAIYYDGFEQGTFPDDPEWTTQGDGVWSLTTDRANSGRYSIQSPTFDLTDVTPKTSNVTLALTDPDFEGGTLVFSALPGTAMLIDALWIYIDGVMMGDLGMLKEDFERQFIPLAPGPHNITWSYKFNPAPLPALPPVPPGRIGAAFLDDVYVLQLGATLAPIGAPATEAPTPPVAVEVPTAAPSIPSPDVPVPTPVPVPTVPTTVAPTIVPAGALYYESFEQGTFPADPEWTTEGDEQWELTSERANSGVYSIRSPVFFDPEDLTPKTSNVTLVTNPAWDAGTLVFSALAGVEMPFDDLQVVVDGVLRSSLNNMQEFERQEVILSPGPHIVTFSYKYNPAPVDFFPPEMPGRIGAAFIDDVYFLPEGVELPPLDVPGSAPTTIPPTTKSPTSEVEPTPVPAPTTVAPTLIPPGAEWYDGFEQGTFPDGDPEWTTEGDGLWEVTSERANSGVFSIRSPDFFDPDDSAPKTANVTLRTNPNWDSGALIFSVLAGVNIPFDDFVYYVDGVMRGRLERMTDFEQERIELSPGAHTIVFSYKYSPIPDLEFFPPIPPDHIGAAFIDDVHFVPTGAGQEPAPTTLPPAEAGVPVAPTAPTTIAPTSTPPGALYFDGFEQATFPGDPEWTTTGTNLWALSTERANSGVYSIKSPTFGPDDLVPKTSNVTLVTNPAWDAGSIVFSALAGTNMPRDDFVYYVDDEFRGPVAGAEGMADFEQREIQLSPGGHKITWSYRWNSAGVDAFPPLPADRIGAAFIDDVYFLPAGVELPAPGPVPPTSSPSSYYPTYIPSKSPVIGGGEAPPVEEAPPASGDFFDGFETGDFSGLAWEIAGEQAWVVDDTNPFEGTYSAHVKTADITEQGDFSELNLDVILDETAFIQFYFYAPVAMPFENFELRVDGEFLTGLSTDDETWTQAGAILSAGPHQVSWRLTNNPSGVPEDMLGNLPQPPFRTGEAWLDNVSLLPSTASFTEIWETGDFSANPWVLSGDGEWSVTDSNASEGTYSATVASSDIEADAAGVAELSIDIITEQGGTLTYNLLAPIEGPFEIANVLVDDIAVLTYASVLEEWIDAAVDIQPGKRKVTFQLVSNPGGIPAEVLSTVPSPPGREGQIWVDNIVFTANDAPPSR